MSFSIAMNLKEAVRAKMHHSYLRVLKVRMTVPAKSTVQLFVEVPEGEVWLMIGDVHDVPSGVFKHGCIKDGFTAFEPMLIEGDNMTLYYTIPWIAEDYLLGTIVNTADTDEVLRLSIYFAILKRDWVEQLKREIEFEEEVKRLLIEAWEEASPEEKTELVKLWMQKPPWAAPTVIG